MSMRRSKVLAAALLIGLPVVCRAQDDADLMETDDQLECLNEVDLNVRPGELVVLAGESGAGKTTLLRILTPIPVPTEGTISGNCLDRFIDWVGGTASNHDLAEGTPFRPGYLMFDWDDGGANVPALGVSTGFPVFAGVIPADLMALSGRTQIRTLLVAFDPVYIELASSLGIPSPGEGGVAEGAAVMAATEAARQGEDAVPAFLQLRALSAAAVMLLDDTGNSIFDLYCQGDVRAWRYKPSGESRSRVAVAGALVGEPEILIMDCPTHFTVSGN